MTPAPNVYDAMNEAILLAEVKLRDLKSQHAVSHSSGLAWEKFDGHWRITLEFKPLTDHSVRVRLDNLGWIPKLYAEVKRRKEEALSEVGQATEKLLAWVNSL